MMRQAEFLKRRYCVEEMGRKFPWPGASTLCMPVEDTAIKRLLSSYVQSTLGADPIVVVRGESPESIEKEPNVERRLRHMVESRIPNAEQEITLAAELLLQHGHVTVAVTYDKRTRMAREVIYRDRLPGKLGELIGKAPLSEKEANIAYAFSGRPRLSQKDIGQGEPEIRRLIRDHYGLNPKETGDRKTENAMYSWLLSGKDSLVIKRREVYRDTPSFCACLPEDVIVGTSACGPEDATQITLRRRLSPQQFIQEAHDCGWDKKVVSDVQDKKLQRAPQDTGLFDYLTQMRQYVHNRAGQLLGRAEYDGTESLLVYTTFFWKDIDGDGYPERCVCVWTPAHDVPLTVYELPFDFYEWPVVQIRREHAARGWYQTRGVPEILDGLSKETTENHRQKINSMAILNAPTLKRRANSGAGLPQWIPGQVMDVQRMDDLEFMATPAVSQSYVQEEQILTNWIERLAGIFDASLTDQGRLTRPRTATEISGVTSLQEQSIGADLLLWHKGWAKVWRMLWSLDVQFGPDELWLKVTGLDEPIRQTRHEIQGRFDFQPSPAALSSPVIRLQKAQLIANLLLQSAQSGVDFGDQYEVSPAEALRLVVREVEPRLADKIIRKRTPEEIAQIEAQKAQAAQGAQIPPQAFNGPPALAAQRATQAADLSQQSGVPIQVRGLGGFV